jgi:dTDP-glucose 4,6-dehydratase
MKKYLITGGCGFIGSHVIDELLNISDVEIFNIDKMGVGSSLDNVSTDLRVKNFLIDICDVQTLTVIEACRPDYIIHLAAESHVDRSIDNPISFIESNVNGTANILEAMRRFAPNARMVHVSTDEVYGHLHPEDDPFTEQTPLDPRSPYSASKAGSDVLALSYKNTYGLDITVTRCCNNYGPKQHDEKLIPTVIRSLVTGKKIPVYGNGQNIREWIYAKDHAKAIIEALYIGTKSVYNIYGTERYDNIGLINKIIETLIKHDTKYDRGSAIDSYIEYVADRPGHDLCYKMASIYDDIYSLKNQIDFNKGIKETIVHYVDKYAMR